MEYRRLSSRHHVRADAEPRSIRQRGHDVHRLLRRGELHRRPRGNFITGELPIRTGLTTVGQAGASIGIPDEAATIATALKAHGLCHRPVRQEPSGRSQPNSCRRSTASTSSSATSITSTPWKTRAASRYPQDLLDTVGPRNLVHCCATDHRRSDGAAALGQGRQAENRGRRHALSETDGDLG